MTTASTSNEHKCSKRTATEFLMCAPDLYDVDYVINPWMEGNLHRSSRERACVQWQTLYDALSGRATIHLIQAQAGSPDMVFTANAGLECGGTVIPSRFFHPERQGEEAHFRRWFEAAGYRLEDLAGERGVDFEGEGDALFSADGETLFAGYGPRTTLRSHDGLRAVWPVEVVSLGLIDPRFYHLDTCFAPLPDGSVLYYPAAFDAGSLRRIEEFYPAERRIAVDEADALRFACNAVAVGEAILLNCVGDGLAARLGARGFALVQLDLSEFLKAGGAAKCLVMGLSGRRVTTGG